MRQLTIAIFATLLLLLIPQALAIPSPATGLTEGATSTRDLSTLNVTSVNAYAGNVTALDINALSVTQSWQGYYGNISGNLVLADGNNNSLYEWGNGTSNTGEIYASRNNSISWTTINCSNTTHITQEETFLGQSATDTDSVTNTFNETDHPSFLVGAQNMTSCPSTNTYVSGAAQNTDFEMILLADANNNTVYTTIIDDGTTGYNGQSHDFQMLVGDDGHAGDTQATTYYFYTELG